MYQVIAADLQNLYDQRFALRNHTFEIQSKSTYRARSGLEAYVLRVLHQHPEQGSIDALLKIFKVDVPTRQARTEFLMNFAHRLRSRLLRGIPYASLSHIQINGLIIVGHLTKFITSGLPNQEDDFAVLKDTSFDFGADHRRVLAVQLAKAVAELENEGFVHGDVNATNLMILKGAHGPPACFLCDFDGFYHELAPKLPRRYAGLFVRPLGSEGYQYPKLLEQIRSDSNNSNEQIFVETDRFAMAATICELMTWNNNTIRTLLRGTLLSDDVVASRSLKQLPDEIVRVFPGGFGLLQKALDAPRIDMMPSPEQWIALLSQPGVVSAAIPSTTPSHQGRQQGDSTTEDFVFISYSKGARHLTEELAQHLEGYGYTVWWDTDLVSGDAYSDVIVDRLKMARAVIVIWSLASIQSKWVYSEALRAQRQSKFIQVAADGITINEIPPPFDVFHLEPLTNSQAIRKALNRMQVSPRATT